MHIEISPFFRGEVGILSPFTEENSKGNKSYGGSLLKS